MEFVEATDPVWESWLEADNSDQEDDGGAEWADSHLPGEPDEP